MANYYASARTNYFLVKDIDAFTNEAGLASVEVITREVDGVTYVGMLSLDEAGFPWSIYDEESEDDIEIQWGECFARHLQDDEVAIIMEVGSEKLRYLNGSAIAYNNKGDAVSINLEDIYELAKPLGKNITAASY